MSPDKKTTRAAPSHRNKPTQNSISMLKEGRPKHTDNPVITEAPRSSYAFVNSFEEQASIKDSNEQADLEDSEDGIMLEHHDGHVAPVGQMHQTSDVKILDRAAAPSHNSVSTFKKKRSKNKNKRAAIATPESSYIFEESSESQADGNDGYVGTVRQRRQTSNVKTPGRAAAPSHNPISTSTEERSKNTEKKSKNTEKISKTTEKRSKSTYKTAIIACPESSYVFDDSSETENSSKNTEKKSRNTKKRSKNTNETATIVAPESSYASGDSFEGQADIRDSEDEITFLHHDDHVRTVRQKHQTSDTEILDRAAAPSHRNKPPPDSIPRLAESASLTERRSKNTSKMAIIAAPESSYASGDLSEGQADIKDSENEITRDDGHVATVRQRNQTSNAKILVRAAAQDKHVRPGKGAILQVQEKSFRSHVENDGSKLIKIILTLPRTLYPLWKWLLIYVGWLAITYLVASIYRSTTVALAPICDIKFIGSQLPFCIVLPGGQPVNASKIATSQDRLTTVIDRVGQSFDLARDMVGREFAIRDLRIRVAASNLSRKKELTQELESLILYTKPTAK